jgi:hypothetical protein
MRLPQTIPVLCVAIVVGVLQAGIAGAANDLARVLKQRYQRSAIEVQNAGAAGVVSRPGTRFRLQADGVPAKPFRVAQLNTKSPRFHVDDFAEVRIVSDRAVGLEPGTLNLPKSTEVVLLDLTVHGNQVRLFTHTARQLAGPGGRPTYGCTEFVFRFDPGSVRPEDAALVESVIERWLAPIA